MLFHMFQGRWLTKCISGKIPATAEELALPQLLLLGSYILMHLLLDDPVWDVLFCYFPGCFFAAPPWTQHQGYRPSLGTGVVPEDIVESFCIRVCCEIPSQRGDPKNHANMLKESCLQWVANPPGFCGLAIAQAKGLALEELESTQKSWERFHNIC